MSAEKTQVPNEVKELFQAVLPTDGTQLSRQEIAALAEKAWPLVTAAFQSAPAEEGPDEC